MRLQEVDEDLPILLFHYDKVVRRMERRTTKQTTLQNALGASIDVNGVSAAFSTSELQKGRDVVILYDGGTEKRVPITEVTLLNWMLLPDIRQK